MQQIIVDIHLSNEEYLQHYRGTAKNVIATSRDGRRVRFPAAILQPFVLHNGIHGCFAIRFDADGKFVDVRRA